MTGGDAARDFAALYRRLAAELGSGGEDLLHEALLKFLRYRARLERPGAELGYLRRVLQTCATDQSRAQQRRAAGLAEYGRLAAADPDAQVPTATGESAADLERRHALAAWLHRSIPALPAPLAEVAHAVLVAGESQRAFAARRDLPYSTAKSRLQRARALLLTWADECCEIRRDARGDIAEVRPRCCP